MNGCTNKKLLSSKHGFGLGRHINREHCSPDIIHVIRYHSPASMNRYYCSYDGVLLFTNNAHDSKALLLLQEHRRQGQLKHSTEFTPKVSVSPQLLCVI